ncbi:MAG: four helix bundle protein [Arenimonas sp.]|nr:four helix bundle protein [Arenimonas sp.]
MEPPSSRNHSTHPFTFRDLLVWKQSRSLASDIYRLTETHKLRGHYAYCDQLGRAALSVPSNIAEGDERGTNKESLRFLFIARGSLGELETQLWVGQDIGWIEPDAYRQLSEKRADVARLLGGLIRMRQQRLKASET